MSHPNRFLLLSVWCGLYCQAFAAPTTRPSDFSEAALLDALTAARAYLFDAAAQAELDTLKAELHELEAREKQATDASARQRLSAARTDVRNQLIRLAESCPHRLDAKLTGRRAVAEPREPVALPGDAGALLLRLDAGAGDMHALRTQYDLSLRRDPIKLDIAPGGTTWAIIELAGAPGGISSLTLEFQRPGDEPIPLIVPMSAPQPAHLAFKAVSAETGELLPVMLELVWQTDGKVRRPANAVDLSPQFEFLGREPGPRPAKLPGKLANHHWWCVPGPFDMPIPPGQWHVIVRHGLEHLPIFDTFTATPGERIERKYALRRWANMPERGWYSGDGHVHSQLTSDRDAQRLLAWAKAEDTHVINVLKVSDVYRTWFEQRGFGPDFRVRDGEYVLVPGQECPRTHSDGFGHTLSWNTKRYVRNVAEYWLYDRVADAVREQGGLFGFAHTYILHPYIRRGMSLIATRPRVDLAEIMQVATMGTDFYYDWLNLGYKLTATAGSDVPFQGTIGEVRMYAYTGKQSFSADAWFDAVKAGRTFVTNGPMLDLHVDDALPGGEIRVIGSRPLRVRARATGHPELMTPQRLEIIRHGEVIRSVDASDPPGHELLIEFEVPDGDGFWLAVRAAGSDGSLAHTSPVYVVREGLRFWKFDAVAKLIDQRMANLDDVEQLIARAKELTATGKADANLTAQTMTAQTEPLLERVREARKFYENLRREAERERPLRTASAPAG